MEKYLVRHQEHKRGDFGGKGKEFTSVYLASNSLDPAFLPSPENSAKPFDNKSRARLFFFLYHKWPLCELCA